MKQLKDKHETAIEELKTNMTSEHEEAMSKLVFQKNNDINKIHME